MASFAYRAYLRDGSSESGVVEATDRREATRKLAQADKRPFHLDEVSGTPAASIVPGARPLFEFRRSTDVAKLLSELSVLLDAGFNVAAALRIVASAEASAPERAKLLAISDQIANGKSLAEAFAALPGLSPDMSAMIAAGESSGRIGEVVAQMAERARERKQRRAAITEALVYPAFLVAMIIAAFLFLSLFLMPAIEPIFDSGSVAMPAIVRLMSGFGRFITEDWTIVLAALLVLAALGILALQRPAGRSLLSNATLALPFVGRLRRESAIVRYLDTLSLLTGSGVAMLDALKLAATTCPLPGLRDRLRAVQDGVANGERLQAAFKRTGVFDGATLTLVGIGEESNRLPLLLKRSAVLVETRLKKSIDRIVTFLTPAITIALGLMIGGLVVSVMTALLSINEIAIQ